MPIFDVRASFKQLQDELRVKLGAGDLTAHPTTKGSDSELKWVELLEAFLPRRYAVAAAHIVDVNGAASEQIDVVVYDRQFSPLLFRIGDNLYVPAESVYGVFEVKQQLDKGHLEYAADKIASVRGLERTTAPIVHAGGTIREPKPPFRILGGILTRRSDWSPPFGDSFNDAMAGLRDDGRIDLGCALEHGAFISAAEGLEVDEDDALMAFLLGLLQLLQAVGSVPAIDYARWRQAGLG